MHSLVFFSLVFFCVVRMMINDDDHDDVCVRVCGEGEGKKEKEEEGHLALFFCFFLVCL